MIGSEVAMVPSRVRTARLLAVAADVVQIALAPLFVGGAASPVNDVLDLGMAAAMTWLVGWHWAFLPSFLAELVPGLDLVPTWTAAVFFATRGLRRAVVSPAERAASIDAELVSRRPSADDPGEAERARPLA